MKVDMKYNVERRRIREELFWMKHFLRSKNFLEEF